MKRSKSGMIRFVTTNRDKKILISIFKSKIVSLKQVRKYFFDGGKYNSSKRMSKLSQLGLIEKVSFSKDNRICRAYKITPKGVKFISPYLNYEINHKFYTSDSIEHDLALFDITKVFSNFKMISKIYTESELLSCSEFFKMDNLRPFVDLRSDRVFILGSKESEFFISVEFERVLKSKERYVEKFEDYYKSSSVDAVFYICEDQSMLKSLMSIDKIICKEQESKLYFCTLEDVFKSLGSVNFTKHNDAFIKLK